jgi:glycosyltransferase involved in cell wall biosynthesis
MLIGVVTTSYPRYPGDLAGNFVAGLNRYLEGLGHQVRVVAAGDTDAHAHEHEHADVLRLPSPLFYRGGAPDALARGGGRLAAMRFSLALLPAVRRHLAGCRGLISHFAVPCGVTAALFARGRPHLAIAHSSDVHLLRRSGAEAVLRWLARRADLVYTDASLRVPGAPGRIAPMGVFAAAFAPASEAERAAARARLGLHRPTVLFLGRLVPVKGLPVLLSAMRLGPPSFDLVVAGDGPERTRLTALAAGLPVRFVGAAAPALRRDLLLACDLLCLPSVRLPDGRAEGAPTVLAEALCAGCPVVASDLGGAAARVGDAGRLVPPGDAPALRAALDGALQPGWLAAARARARVHGRQHDWAVAGPRLVGPFIAALSHPG